MEWHLYGLGKQASEDLSTNLSVEQDCRGDVSADANTQHQGQPTILPTATMPVVTPPIVLAESTITSDGLPSDLLPSDPHPALSSKVSADATTADLKVPSHSDCHMSSHENNILFAGINDLPTSVTEAGWMKSKNTLACFHKVKEMGRLSALILHWYQLEEVVGFQEVVCSFLAHLVRKSADPDQTPKGFPTRNHPAVLSAFFKNSHNYKKNYKLEVETLDAEVMLWWEEIKVPNMVANVHFGGPTRIYNIIILVSW